VIALLNAYWAGRSNRRYIHIVVPAGVTLAAMVILASVTNTAVRYAAMCIMLSGNSAYSLVMTWLVNTLGRPASKRASALSVVSTLATINHLYNAFIFRGMSQDMTLYRPIQIPKTDSSLCRRLRTPLRHAHCDHGRFRLGRHRGSDGHATNARAREPQTRLRDSRLR